MGNPLFVAMGNPLFVAMGNPLFVAMGNPLFVAMGNPLFVAMGNPLFPHETCLLRWESDRESVCVVMKKLFSVAMGKPLLQLGNRCLLWWESVVVNGKPLSVLMGKPLFVAMGNPLFPH